MRRISLFLIISITMMTLTSCYDSNEIDDLLHIVAIGIDKGVTDKWRLTILFPTLKGDSGSGGGMQKGGGGQEEYTSLTVDAPSFFTGIDMLNSILSRRLN
ncbi:MAG: Ger(x)C family spore germination protein, partial [Clostridiales bacterium]|nr:Ger(x)C family spore germination protein [Clostridiales bacterium]